MESTPSGAFENLTDQLSPLTVKQRVSSDELRAFCTAFQADYIGDYQCHVLRIVQAILEGTYSPQHPSVRAAEKILRSLKKIVTSNADATVAGGNRVNVQSIYAIGWAEITGYVKIPPEKIEAVSTAVSHFTRVHKEILHLCMEYNAQGKKD